MAERNSAQKVSTPLHMQELDDDVAILPQSMEPSDASSTPDNFQDATFVDVTSEINDSDAKISACTISYPKFS